MFTVVERWASPAAQFGVTSHGNTHCAHRRRGAERPVRLPARRALRYLAAWRPALGLRLGSCRDPRGTPPGWETP